ncbi:MAG: OB-fold nucleic acid binding domain-containing protein, partial [Candidatus Marsarchaeota archaeon]|nr:OB-fold nucleic acid binding domain-containing protein [Candidatus Marsarchaeota archaeon]
MRKGSFENGSTATVYGHLEEVRNLGGLKFLVVRDIHGRVQAVINRKTASPELVSIIDSTPRESVIAVTGTVKADARAPGGFELSPTGFEEVYSA